MEYLGDTVLVYFCQHRHNSLLLYKFNPPHQLFLLEILQFQIKFPDHHEHLCSIFSTFFKIKIIFQKYILFPQLNPKLFEDGVYVHGKYLLRLLRKMPSVEWGDGPSVVVAVFTFKQFQLMKKRLITQDLQCSQVSHVSQT